MSDVTRRAYLSLSQRQTDKWQVTDCTGTTHWASTEETRRDATPAVFASKRIKVNSWLAFFVQLPTGEDTCYSIMTWKQNWVIQGFIIYKINFTLANLFVSILLASSTNSEKCTLCFFCSLHFSKCLQKHPLLESTLCDVTTGTDSFMIPPPPRLEKTQPSEAA